MRRAFILVLVVFLFGSLTCHFPIEEGVGPETYRVAVKLKAPVIATSFFVHTLAGRGYLSLRYSTRVVSGPSLASQGWISVAGSPSALESLTGDPVVEYWELDPVRRLLPEPGCELNQAATNNESFQVLPIEPDQEPFYRYQWDLKAVRAEEAWAQEPGQRVVVAIIDTGLDTTHEEFLAEKLVSGWNVLVDGNEDLQDAHGHGTHCAGIAAAAINGKGIAGMGLDNVLIQPILVLNAQGYGTLSDVAEGIIRAANNGERTVISLSLGAPAMQRVLEEAVSYAWSQDCILVAAAGNESSEQPFWPAAYDEVIAVIATDKSDQRAGFSNYGGWCEISAPGWQIMSSVPGNQYASWSGTSMATPLVAGALAHAWALMPKLTNAEMRARLRTTAIDLGEPGFDTTFAWGLLDAGALARRPEPTPTPTPCAIAPDRFAKAWYQAKGRLGCPTEVERSIFFADEPFEHGWMFWRKDLRRIYALYDGDTWQWFEDTWQEDQPEYSCPKSAPSKTPPTPKRGFGKVWCLESKVRERIGSAEEEERGYRGVVQAFQRGLMITSEENKIYILYDDGTWEEF